MVVKVDSAVYPPSKPATANIDFIKPSSVKASATATAKASPPSAAALPYREFCGNAKRITVESNCQHLRIIGNGNRIFVHRNVGRLEVLGNANRVRVLENRHGGCISYTGNGGRVYLCGDALPEQQAAVPEGVREACVRYTGVNGSVRLVTRDELLRTLATDAKGDELRRQRRRTDGRSGAQPDAGNTPPTNAGKVHSAAQHDGYEAFAATTEGTATATAAGITSTVRDKMRSGTTGHTAGPAPPPSSRRSRRSGGGGLIVDGRVVDDELAQRFQRFEMRPIAEQLCVTNMTVSLSNLVDLSALASIRRQQQQLASHSDLVINGL